MDVRKTIAELTSQLSEVNYDSDEDNLLLADSTSKTDNFLEPSIENNEYDDVEPSKLRKANESVVLPEHVYGGKTISRKKTDSFSSFSEENLSKDGSINEGSVQSYEEIGDEEDESGGMSEEVSSNEGEGVSFDLSQNPVDHENNTSSADCKIYSSRSKNISSDVKKGSAIRSQLRLWESLLECRIKLQKGLVACNDLPSKEDWIKFKSQLDSESRSKVNKCNKSLLALLGKFTELQEALLKRSEEYTSSKVQKLSKLDEEIPSDESEIESEGEPKEEEEEEEAQPPRKKRKLHEYSSLLQDHHNKFIPVRNAIIQKWNDKTKVSTGKMANSNFSAFDHSTLKQIEQIMSDKTRLINRTRIKRTDQDSNVKNQDDAQETKLDPEIFDDTDFYHKLLRDFIERKSVDVNTSRSERQMIELQTLRNKMKKNVDTKSTKGRKLRYVVLPKLVNFMAPDPYNTWSEQAETELYNSLFGKIKV